MREFLIVAWPLLPALLLGLLAGLLLRRAAAAEEDFGLRSEDLHAHMGHPPSVADDGAPGWERRASGPSPL